MQLKIFSAEKASLEELGGIGKEPGTILSDSKTFLAVTTRDGALLLKDIQLSGKKRMEVGPFLLGFREPCSFRTTKGTSYGEILKARPKTEQ